MIILRFHTIEFHMLLWIIYHMLCLHFPNPWKNFKYLVSALLSNALHRLSRKLNCFKIFTLSAGSADSAIFSPSRLITSTVGLRSSSNLWRSYKKAIRHQVIKKHCNNTSLKPEGARVLESVLKGKKSNAYIVIKAWITLIKETPAPAPPLPLFLVFDCFGMNSTVSASPNACLGFYQVKMCGRWKTEHIEEKVLSSTIEGNKLFKSIRYIL